MTTRGRRWATGGDNVTVASADGLQFLCPVCFKANGGPVGTHTVVVWKRGVEVDMGPGRWTMTGNGLEDLTLDASVHTREGCGAHFHVKNGQVIGC